MLVVGLTGGIGAGKSTVSALLAERGAIVVDADAINHEVQAPGGPAYKPIVKRWPEIVRDDGTIDRPKLAGIVFRDPKALADLQAMTHPAIAGVIGQRISAQAATDNVVILDVPLLVESGRGDHAGVLVVDCPEDIAVARAVARGMEEDDVRRRIAAQTSREERKAIADFVVDNSGDLEHLRAEVERAWEWIEGLRAERQANSRQ